MATIILSSPRGADVIGRRRFVEPARLSSLATAVLIAAWLAVGVFVRPIDHDEGQYFAAARLAGQWLPYRDFDYLQTPLQPLLLAPLVRIAAGHGLLVLRAVNAAMIWCATWLVGQAARRMGGDRRTALLVMLAMATCEPIAFAGAIARNDAMPCLMLCGGLFALTSLRAPPARPSVVRSAVVGLCLSAAAATKISYALPLASIVAIEGYWRHRGEGRLHAGAFLLAAALPAALVVALALASPARFWFDVLVFPSLAPAEWWTSLGQAAKLPLPHRAFDLLRYLCLGAVPGLLVLIATVRQPAAAPNRWLGLHIAALAAAGCVAAILPAPVWRQYLVPAIPPLLLLFVPALRAADLRDWRGIGVLAGMLAGCVPTLCAARGAIVAGSPPLTTGREAACIGRVLADRGVRTVTSLEPLLIDAPRIAPDPRFAAGPFLFRTQDGLGWQDALVGVTRGSLATRLAAAPPQAILTGGDSLAGSAALDAALDRWARSRGYASSAAGPAGLRLWMRPRSIPDRAPIAGCAI